MPRNNSYGNNLGLAMTHTPRWFNVYHLENDLPLIVKYTVASLGRD